MNNKWSIQKSKELYLISRWGEPYFSINNHGNLICIPMGKNSITSIDLKFLIDDLISRNILPPFVIRFNNILHQQAKIISNNFKNSIEKYKYQNKYHCIMPIKVNQQRHIVEELINQLNIPIGLEIGSKSELLIALALLTPNNPFLICNGYKDYSYIEIILSAQKLFLKPYIVLDRFKELDYIFKISKEKNIKPLIGIRAKMSYKGSGHWENSSGDSSKFGLSSEEIVEVVKELKENNMLKSLQLLHFHIGSQITNINSIKNSLKEATHIYCNLRQMGCSFLKIINVGGGLAIDYDGSKSNFHSSRNYSTQEYANDVVSIIQDICDESFQPHPLIMSESGRFLVAHHSVLIFNILGAHSKTNSTFYKKKLKIPKSSDHYILHEIWDIYTSINNKNFQESYNDAISTRKESISLFNHGMINLFTKAKIDNLFWKTCLKLQKIICNLSYVPEDLENLDYKLSDIYYCNFSVFKSIPDSWALSHLFPILPIHRLNEKPYVKAILADLTCDSDGKIEKFIDLKDIRTTIFLHKYTTKPYYLGIFLVGAYQEILGDLHNLFGNTNVIHLSIKKNNSYAIEHIVPGDTVSKVLKHVQYNNIDLINKIRKNTEKSVYYKKISLEESIQFIKLYKNALSKYTYLED